MKISFYKISLFLLLVFLLFSCSKEIESSDESLPDIVLYKTHYILSESDQEPIIIDADVFEMYLSKEELVMQNVSFRQNKKDSTEPNLEGKCQYLKVNTKTQDAFLEGSIEISIHPEKPPAPQIEKPEILGSKTEELEEIQVFVSGLAEEEKQEEKQEEELVDEQEKDKVEEQNIKEEALNENEENLEKQEVDLGAEEKEEQNEEGELGEKLNKIYADNLKWGKYTSLIESDGHVLLIWDDINLEGEGFKGNINTGEFSFKSIINGSL